MPGGIDPLQDSTVILDHLLKESHDEGVTVLGGLLVERDRASEPAGSRPRVPLYPGQRGVRGLPSQQEGRYTCAARITCAGMWRWWATLTLSRCACSKATTANVLPERGNPTMTIWVLRSTSRSL